MKLGLPGIIDDMISKASHSTLEGINFEGISSKSKLSFLDISKVITHIEDLGNVPL